MYQDINTALEDPTSQYPRWPFAVQRGQRRNNRSGRDAPNLVPNRANMRRRGGIIASEQILDGNIIDEEFVASESESSNYLDFIRDSGHSS